MDPYSLDALWPLIGVGVVVVLVVGVFVVTSVLGALRRRRVARMPITAIAAAEPGKIVKVCGRARRLDETFTAPISGRPCLAYIVRIDQHTRSNQHGFAWQRWSWERKHADLLVEDRTGTMRLAVDWAVDLDLDYDREIESASFQTLDPRIARFLEERGTEPPTGILFRRRVRCREYVLREAQAVMALGRVDVDSSRGESDRHVLRHPSPKDPLLLTNQSTRVDESFLPVSSEPQSSVDVDVDVDLG